MSQWENAVRTAMQSYTAITREQSNGEQRFKSSPFREGSDSSGFMVNWKEGVYNDFAGTGGTLRQLAEKLNIPVPANGQRHPVVDTLREYRDLADYAAAHGAPVEAFTKAGWQDTTHTSRKALSFPLIGGTKYRYIDGHKPKFTGKGIHKPWYGLKGAPALASKQAMKDAPLVICNGEPSVVVAQWFGIPAVCVAGGEGAIPDNRMAELNAAWSGPLVVALDCDAKGRASQAAIVQQFDPKRIKTVDLGLGNKGDLADFCKLYGADSWAELMSRAKFVITTPPDALAQLREVTGQLQQLRRGKDSDDGTEARRLVAIAETCIDRLKDRQPSQALSFVGLSGLCHDRFESACQNPAAIGLRSGLEKVDQLVGGSWLQGLNYVCLGDTGMGKTTLMASLAVGLMHRGPGLICCTEMPPHIWYNKLAAYIARVQIEKILYGTANAREQAAVKAAYKTLAEHNCHMIPETKPTKHDIEHQLEGHAAQWLIIDSLNKLAVPGSNGIYERTCGASEAAQDLAKSYNLVVISTSQVGRAVSDRENKIPTPNDGYGGGAIEQDARSLMTIYYHQRYVDLGLAAADPKLPKGVAMVKMLKHNFVYVAQDGALLNNVGGIGFFNSTATQVDMRVKDD